MTTSPQAPPEPTGPTGPAGPGTPTPRPRVAWLVAVAIVVVLAGAIAAWALTRDVGSSTASPAPAETSAAQPPGPSLAPAAPPVPVNSAPAASAPAAVPSSSASVPAQAASGGFRFQPLWPFTSVAQATSWQASSAAGHQPWHLDAGLTAISFAHDVLRYQEMNKVVSVRTEGDEAWVGVGATPDAGQPRTTAAVLHLARIGTGDVQPWEVVGSQDTRLTVTAPRHGSSVTSPLTVGGRITGVDESLQVKVLAGGKLLGERTGIPAGGDKQPWSVTLPFIPSPSSPITVAVSTGGHLREVEAFAITALVVR